MRENFYPDIIGGQIIGGSHVPNLTDGDRRGVMVPEGSGDYAAAMDGLRGVIGSPEIDYRGLSDHLRGLLTESRDEASALRNAVIGLKCELANHVSVNTYLALCSSLGLDPALDSASINPADPALDHSDEGTLADRVNRAIRDGSLS